MIGAELLIPEKLSESFTYKLFTLPTFKIVIDSEIDTIPSVNFKNSTFDKVSLPSGESFLISLIL